MSLRLSTYAIVAIITLFVSVYFYSVFAAEYQALAEPFTSAISGAEDEIRCPNILIQSGKTFYLYNSRVAKVPGVNPIGFSNLEDYVEFLDWQRSQGIRCPVLFMQKTYDAQGNEVFKVRPSASDPQAGLPPGIDSLETAQVQTNPNPMLLLDAGRDDAPYNEGGVPAYDPSSMYVGATTPLDIMSPAGTGAGEGVAAVADV